MAEQFTSVAKLGKPHGTTGAFRFYMLREPKKNTLPEHFLVKQNGSMVPWFIAKTEWLSNSEGFIWFEEILNRETAKNYSGKELFLPDAYVPKYFLHDATDSTTYYGYAAFEEKKGFLGTITDSIENSAQTLLVVKKEQREILIPCVDEFITSINQAKKEIVFTLPEGLLDL